MDTNHFLSLMMGLTVHERENLESIMDGQSSREGLGGVELPLTSLNPQCTPKLPLHPLTTLHLFFFMTISGCFGECHLGSNDQ